MTTRGSDTQQPQPLPTRLSAERLRRGARALLFGFAVLVAIDAVVGEEGWFALKEARRMDAALRRALEQARADNAQLRARVAQLRGQRSAIEAVARQDLGLIKPGETLFIVRGTPSGR